MTRTKDIDRIVAEALAIEGEEAEQAGALGYMARVLTQCTLPHSKTTETQFTRTNGRLTLTISAMSARTGLPYGPIPRLLLSWMTTEAVRTKSPDLELGDTLSGFMRELGMIPSGGRWGTIGRLKEQTRRLFSAGIACETTHPEADAQAILNMRIASRALLWWEPKSPDQASLWGSRVTMSPEFFEEVTRHPVPVDLRALRALKGSPMALDVYCWATYRLSYLKRATEIPWEALQAQFGAGYAETPQGKAEFKRAFLRSLGKVQTVYRDLMAEPERGYLILKPGYTHIRKVRTCD